LLVHAKDRELQRETAEGVKSQDEQPLIYDKDTIDKILAYNRLAPVTDPAPLDLKDLRLATSTSSGTTPREGPAVISSRWHLGVEAVAPSVTVNRELQMAMRNADLMWFGVSPWKLRVRSRTEPEAFQLTVTVYKVQTQRYIIDVCLHAGELATAFTAAQTLVRALSTNGKLGNRSPALFTTS
jgi:hypothetical protein